MLIKSELKKEVKELSFDALLLIFDVEKARRLCDTNLVFSSLIDIQRRPLTQGVSKFNEYIGGGKNVVHPMV